MLLLLTHTLMFVVTWKLPLHITSSLGDWINIGVDISGSLRYVVIGAYCVMCRLEIFAPWKFAEELAMIFDMKVASVEENGRIKQPQFPDVMNIRLFRPKFTRSA